MSSDKLQLLHQDIPDGDDVTDGACEDEEVEYGMHVFPLVQAVEDGSRDVAHPLGYQPDDCSGRHAIHQRFKGHKDAQAHTYETEGFQI